MNASINEKLTETVLKIKKKNTFLREETKEEWLGPKFPEFLHKNIILLQ